MTANFELSHPSPSAEEFAHVVARVDSLTHEVESLKTQLATRDPGPQHDVVCAAIDQVRAMTIEVFGNVGEIEATCDIEDETWRIIVVHVEDSGAVSEMVARFRVWHERLSEVSADVRGMFRLLLCPRE